MVRGGLTLRGAGRGQARDSKGMRRGRTLECEIRMFSISVDVDTIESFPRGYFQSEE